MATEFDFADEAQVLAFGAAIAPLLRAGDVIALRGGLGAGKTTLTRGILAALGLQEEAPSPTFAIVQPYAPPEVSLPLAHVDLYRIDDAADIDELGLDEYLYDGALVIEWPERMGARLWPDALILDIAIMPDGTRRLTATIPPAWKDRWPPR
ncbi:MAG: tRNA (adenosine(37)-N6)-threonylcarbamoyltransferase complex ATPase subunit type 1 TsaE [Sphingobium sp.]|jgi:tRNA threonylcarbamoyladenosine biosynthesis protein TsaE|nr:tRNA (adenosine(37)-N6)-threonylcarbamoyltransferase complex ATPase subunit type 1 TsaE [Sphingobium sp.]MCP5398828.1 tRNA (adenosine(37)-N6)-threonylcarbamoyltransferase complex ATPase subunit type 1 TsaE [Sphingomonas sp.]